MGIRTVYPAIFLLLKNKIFCYAGNIYLFYFSTGGECFISFFKSSAIKWSGPPKFVYNQHNPGRCVIYLILLSYVLNKTPSSLWWPGLVTVESIFSRGYDSYLFSNCNKILFLFKFNFISKKAFTFKLVISVDWKYFSKTFVV